MQQSNSKIKVVVVDDHHLVVNGLESLINEYDNIEFVGGFTTIKGVLDYIKENEVDIVLADINLHLESGIELCKQIKKANNSIKVLAVTMQEDVSSINQMLNAGASGYVLKKSNVDEIIEAIRTIHVGKRYLGSHVQDILIANMDLESEMDVANEKSLHKSLLTKRELEILQLIGKEYSNALIAEKLFISERTVETHRKNIFVKTKTKSIIGLIKYAIDSGYLEGGKG